MSSFGSKKLDTLRVPCIFGYGGIVHLLMFWWLAQPVHPEVRAREIHSVGLGIFLLGGIVELALFYRPETQIKLSMESIVVNFALPGMLATFVVIEVYLIFLAIVATHAGWYEPGTLPLKAAMFGLMLLSTHVYGLGLFVRMSGLGLLQGLIVGFFVIKIQGVGKLTVGNNF